MRIVEHNPQRLVLADRPSTTGLFAAMLFGVLIWMGSLASPFGAAGMATLLPGIAGAVIIVYVFARGAQLTLDRAEDRFILSQTSVLGRRRRVLPLGALAGATLQRSRGATKGNTLRLALVLRGPTGHTEVPLSPVFTRSAGPGRAAETINAWLATSEA